MTGRIHSMESFGTVDGPGIRFVVFLQGCRWRCRYCHNPDTWRLDGGTEMESSALHDTLLRYRTWFDSSGGGVTVSGGEPLLQSAFVTDLFTRLKASGIHTCLDTNGDWPGTAQPRQEAEMVPLAQDPALEALLAVTDLVLLDIKHPDPETHRSLTGADSEPTLRFLERLRERGVATWLRYVVVPGWTDAPDAISAVRRLQESCPNISEIQWLPYHRMGIYKWNELGIPYSLHDVPAADADLMERIRNGQI